MKVAGKFSVGLMGMTSTSRTLSTPISLLSNCTLQDCKSAESVLSDCACCDNRTTGVLYSHSCPMRVRIISVQRSYSYCKSNATFSQMLQWSDVNACHATPCALTFCPKALPYMAYLHNIQAASKHVHASCKNQSMAVRDLRLVGCHNNHTHALGV